MKLNFGKHGKDDISTVPSDYLDWLKGRCEETIAIICYELTRRRATSSTLDSLSDFASPGEKPSTPAKDSVPDY